jgi:UDP-N-acetyl-D-galactosamine dehydrogenase
MKIVSGCCDESLQTIHDVYSLVIEAGLHKAPSIKVAEAAKIIENTQRDLNIALMNELSMIFNKMNINTYDVLAAAGTKWNFHHYKPGLVGGHCIGVDPYYLTYKATALGFHPRIILAGRATNDSMGAYIAKSTIQKMIAAGKNLKDAKVLVMGATFKENVTDIRNSKVADVIEELKTFMVHVEVTDPFANSEELEHEYGFGLIKEIGTGYDAIIVAVPHEPYKSLTEEYFKSISTEGAVLMDLKGIFKDKFKTMTYWSL